MADFLNKNFLDYEGLAKYDELIKKYIQKKASSNETVTTIVNNLAAIAGELGIVAVNEDGSLDLTGETRVDKIDAAIAKLNADADIEGSVDAKIAAAIAELVNGAPETLDTLKEIADIIGNVDGENPVTAILTQLTELKEALAENTANLKDYIDAQDTALYNSIQAIEHLKIAALFPVKQTTAQSAAQAIAAVEDGAAVELLPNQIITEDIAIEKDCYIDANGATFNGVVTIPADAEVVVENAVFANPVVIA